MIVFQWYCIDSMPCSLRNLAEAEVDAFADEIKDFPLKDNVEFVVLVFKQGDSKRNLKVAMIGELLR